MPITARRRAPFSSTTETSPAALRWRAAQAARLVMYPPAWLRLVEDVVVAETGRRDLRDHLLTYVRALAFRARGDATTCLTRAEAADLLGVTERTVSKLRRWLADRGLLLTVEEGSTATTRGAHAAPGLDGNRGAVYLLTRPVEEVVEDDETRCLPTQELRKFTPPLSVRREDQRNPARARETPCAPATGEPGRRLRRDGVRSRGQRKSDELRLSIAVLDRLAALAEHEHAPHLDTLAAGVGPAFLRSLLRAAGLLDLDVEAVVWAIRHAPDGTRHTVGTAPGHPVAVLRWRLGLWSFLVARYGPEMPFRDLRRHREVLDEVRVRREVEALDRAIGEAAADVGLVEVRAILAAGRAARASA
ncbi:hypothetical protein [Kineococcus rhizosphaerae]|uniref:Uncharacterized protein n=1 Tax=Kineococcus rhizosphaerae TaxID=559628 RepID=A0A2T0QLP5_9ACTN|nr:hypothetical protein [Kineococcus rhizosphaerae]PRY05402.1 hypothetical protein CLV37_13914 [Kineococcus rhizosphaerae]